MGQVVHADTRQDVLEDQDQARGAVVARERVHRVAGDLVLARRQGTQRGEIVVGGDVRAGRFDERGHAVAQHDDHLGGLGCGVVGARGLVVRGRGGISRHDVRPYPSVGLTISPR
ncbi:MAG: hypothetical protein NVV66_05860 [Cellulomonas sp.]|uniref:hypothetical protein n=1 Tax=Cellulomonas sp. TaxID=40001 RepID=UPI0025825EAF|nr:hypothetical protein [Cellulomonas sp.]MCR6704222.1 hypothetical protein [Cellulomonas sp.]